ncbi:hypothetical protein [Fundidesulfovibrio agrisoli]|uniref:hypothetical protein n=1 Tax=Fundidesulfovibrio agrisoli TaxID=2922717 RepID=UPI001FAE3593|nr:hypothetical protein [Fundidesulfovibrio agrisoli]
MAKKKNQDGSEGSSGIPESRYNARALRELIHAGDSATEIMEKLNIRHKQTLRQHVLKLISDDKQYYEVRGLYMKSSSRPKVKKNGVLCINLSGVKFDGRDVVEGDEFVVNIESDHIVLRM